MGTRVSVIVVNYNYARFLGAAIDSALAQDYPDVEVLVVDDGSADNSRDVIAGYGEPVRVLLKANGGMCSAVNAAFALTTGSIIVIVDADDFLHADAVRRVVAEWQPGCSKVQFQLSLVDAAGVRRGADSPVHVAMPTGDVLPQQATTGRYPCAITVGNAYDRVTVAALSPLPETGPLRNSADGYLNPLCPFYGPIVSLSDELGRVWLFWSDRCRGRHDRVEACACEAQTSSSRHKITVETHARVTW